MSKSPDAFRTISEVAEWLGIQAHVLRFWESKFTQIKPVKRAGGRRYYRPADVDLLGSIKVLLHDQGMAIKDVQALLREHGAAHVASLADPDAPSAAQGDAAASDVEPIENASAGPVQGDVIEATVEATFEPVEPPATPAPTPPAPAAAPGAWAEPASPAPATAAPTPAPAPAPQAMPPAAEAPQAAPTPVQADPAQPVQTQPVQTQPQMQAQPPVQPTVQPPAAPPAAASDAAEQTQPTATPAPTAPTYAAPVQDGVTQAAAPTQAPADPAPSYQPQAPSALAHGATAPAAAGIGDDAPAPQAPAAAVSTPAAAGPAPIVPTASPSVSVDPVQAAVSETGDIHPPEPQSETALPQTSFGAAGGSSAAVPAYDSAPTAPQPAQSTLFGESTEAPAPSPAAPVSAAPSPAVAASAEPVATPPARPATSDHAGEHLQPDLLGDLPQIEEPAELIEAADSLPSDLTPVAEVDMLAPAPEDVEAAAVEAPSAPQSPLPQDTAPATPFADAVDEPPATNVTDAPALAADMPAQTAPQEAPATDIFAAETAVDAPADLAEPSQPVDEGSDFTQAPAMDPDLGANPAEVEIDLADHTDAPVFDAEADLDDNPLAVAGALDQEPADVAPLDVAEAPAAALVDDLGDDLGGHADPLAEPLAEAEDLPDLAALDGVDVDQALHDAPYESEEPTPEDAPLDMFDAPQEPEAEFAADMEAAAEQMAAEDSALDDSAAEDLLAVDPVETVEAETVAPDDALHDAAQDLTAPMEQLAEISQPIAGAEDAGSLAEEPAQELELGDSADVASDAVAFELDRTKAGAEQQDAEAETQAPTVMPASEDVAEGEVRAEDEAPAEEIPAQDMSADMPAEPAGASDDAPLPDEVSIDLPDDLKGDLPDDLQGDLPDDMSAPLADEDVAAEAETGEVAVDAAETDAGDPLADGLGEELVAEPVSDALADMAPLSEPVSDPEPETIAAEPAPQEQALDASVADNAAEVSTDSQGDQSQVQPLRARVVIVPDLRDGVPEPRAAVLSHLAGLERVPAHLQDEIADCLRALRG